MKAKVLATPDGRIEIRDTSDGTVYHVNRHEAEGMAELVITSPSGNLLFVARSAAKSGAAISVPDPVSSAWTAALSSKAWASALAKAGKS